MNDRAIVDNQLGRTQKQSWHTLKYYPKNFPGRMMDHQTKIKILSLSYRNMQQRLYLFHML
jgi:hypothetical protein